MNEMNERKKHRTVDCDLNDLERLERPESAKPLLISNPSNANNSPPPTTTTTTNTNTNNRHDLILKRQQTFAAAASAVIDNPNDKLSKLTISSSLHQLNDSKYLNQSSIHEPHQQQQQLPATKCNNNNNYNCDQSIHQQQLQPQSQTTAMNNNNNNNTIAARHRDDAGGAIKTRTQKREANLDTVHVVVGNEACDLDSTVSCLLMFHIISKMSDEINGKDKTRTLYIPLLNTTRDMLDSKSEVLWFLEKTLNIDKSFLTCKDDIDWNEIKKNGVEVLITLVDHNYNDEFKDIGKIVEIIDHHQVQNTQWLMDNHSSIRLTIDTSVGSCTTLVAERLFYIYAEHHVSDEILLLIYGTVLLDTICLSEKAKRFTRRDIYLLKKLDALLGSKKPIRDQLYKQIVEVKNSPRELNFEKLMKRDLKVYKDKQGMRVGIASLFGMGAKEALGLAANIDLDLFFRQNQYEAFIIMGLIADLDHSDSISRDLVLISANKRLFDELQKAFEADTSKLDLVPVGSDSSPDPEDNVINNKRIVDSISDQSSSKDSSAMSSSSSSSPLYKARIWLQRNVSSSRKVVAPLVLKVLHDGA